MVLRSSGRSALAWLVGALALVVSSCGGNGEPSGDITLQRVGYSRFTLPEETALPFQLVTVHVGGDLSALDGATVYVVAEDPLGLYAPDVGVSFRDDRFVELSLHGKRLGLTAGHYTGHLTFTAYLDPGLTQVFKNPIRVPYDVTVTPGLHVAKDTLEVQVPFGEVNRVETVSLATSPGVDLESQVDVDGGVPQWRPRITFPDGSSMRVAIPGAPVGTYEQTFKIVATYPVYPPDGGLATYYLVSKDLTVRYTITPNEAAGLVVSPPSSSCMHSMGS